MKNPKDPPRIREAVGVYFDGQHLDHAIQELVGAGFDHSEIGILAGEYTVQQSLGDVYERANEFAASPKAPCTAFVANRRDDDTVHAWLGSLVFYGATTAAGAAVASAAVLGGAVAAAASGAAAIGAAGALMGLIIHKSDAQYLEEQIDDGHLLLFVRAHDAEHEAKALQILAKNCAYEPKVYDVAPCR
jgi:hypothetical protein